jgi:hypothetical protein
MCSDFSILHPSGPIISSTDQDYTKALQKYPELNDDYDISYEKNSTLASINIGGVSYFDN